MSLPTLSSVEKLQQALHTKAKEEPSFRFYALYDKVYRKDVLWQSHQLYRHNDGAPGVDGQTFEDIEQYGCAPTPVFPGAAHLIAPRRLVCDVTAGKLRRLAGT